MAWQKCILCSFLDNLFGGVLSDNEDDALFSKNTGLFSNRPGLFDDLEDTNSSLWGPDEGTGNLL